MGRKQKLGSQHTITQNLAKLKGKLSRFCDVIPPDQELNQYRYGAKIELEKNHLTRKGIDVPVISGMAITANIKLRDKRLISIVSDIFSDNEEAIIQLRQ